MIELTEAKAQGWRAVVVFDDRPDGLITLGRSSTAVRACYAESYLELYDEADQAHVQHIALQRWHGAADAGQWVHQSNLKTPVPVLKMVRLAA